MSWARFNACGFKTSFYAVNAHITFVDFFRLFLKSWNIEGAAGNTVLATNALVLIKINNSVLILNNGAWRRTGVQTTWLLAVKAGILLDEPLYLSIDVNFVKAHQEPRVRRQILVTLITSKVGGGLHLEIVPLLTSDLTALAADTAGNINQFRVFRRRPKGCRLLRGC